MTAGPGEDGEEPPPVQPSWAPIGSVVPEPPPPPPAPASGATPASPATPDPPTATWTPPTVPAAPPPWGTPELPSSAGPPAWGTPPPAASGTPAPPPYGTPPPGPWQYGGFPSGPQQRPQNGVAVAALVCGLASIVFAPLALVGLVLAIVALVQLRGGQQRGRGLAVAGLVVSLLWPALLVGGIATTVSQIGAQIDPAGSDPVSDPGVDEPCFGTCGGTFDGESTYLADLSPGDCLPESPPSLRDQADGSVVDIVDCEEEHLAQVYETPSGGVGTYPGEIEVRGQIQQLCAATLPRSARADVAADRAKVLVAYPGRAAWDETHQGACLLVTARPRTEGYHGVGD